MSLYLHLYFIQYLYACCYWLHRTSLPIECNRSESHFIFSLCSLLFVYSFFWPSIYISVVACVRARLSMCFVFGMEKYNINAMNTIPSSRSNNNTELDTYTKKERCTRQDWCQVREWGCERERRKEKKNEYESSSSLGLRQRGFSDKYIHSHANTIRCFLFIQTLPQ